MASMSARGPRGRRPLPVPAGFDWDGTIVDTLPLIYRANVVVLGELGIPLSREWFRERYTPDWRASYRELGVPDGYRVEAAIAIGRRGDRSLLPESLQAREQPNGRVPLPQVAGEGHLGAIGS